MTALTPITASIKTVIVDALAALPTYRSQFVVAALVRHVWRGFRRA